MTTQLSLPENALQKTEIPAFSALCFTTDATLLTLSRHDLNVAQDLYREAARLDLIVLGPIQWIYTGVNGNETNKFQLEIILPIRQPEGQPAEFSYKVFPAFHGVSYTYRGPWSNFGKLYDALFTQLYREGYQNDGRVREVYSVVDTDVPANCLTEIQIALV